jgi:shikimate dehydrogenase
MSEARPDRYGVMGNPIAHSKSPLIHSLFAHQTGQNLIYTAILVELGQFEQAVTDFEGAEGKGLNVTVPFKQEAWRFVDERSPRAERSGAVNTIVLHEDGRRFGDNTDGVGLVRDLLHNHGAGIKGKRLLLLGAGGAARGVLAPLLDERPAALVIANRTVERALELGRAFSDLGPVSGCGFADLTGERFDIIINATAASLQGEVPPLPRGVLDEGGLCYDMMYGAEPTAFVRWGGEQGALRSMDGLGMLVEQAAESFYIWRGVRPQTRPVIAAVRETLLQG